MNTHPLKLIAAMATVDSLGHFLCAGAAETARSQGQPQVLAETSIDVVPCALDATPKFPTLRD